MPAGSDPTSAADPAALAEQWIMQLSAALEKADARALQSLFDAECYWRDQIGLTWDISTIAEPQNVAAALAKAAAARSASGWRIDSERPAPAWARLITDDVVELYLRFVLPYGSGQGMARLVVDPSAPAGCRCRVLFTDLAVLDGAAERTPNRVTIADMMPKPPIHGYELARPNQTFGEFMAEKMAFAGEDPDVLIIGGGHGGMSIGARLERMGASYLIVDRNDSPGASWRERYESLALHTISAINQLPYLSTPESFSDYSPKDQWADWMDSYARLMQLNYWSRTSVRRGRFDGASRRWAIDLDLAGGTTRTMRPRHVVLATGGIGLTPAPFDFPGLADFAGPVTHSKHFRSGKPFAGQRVLVVGSATSAFDVCLDVARAGGMPVLAQRSPTTVIPLVEGVRYMGDYLPGRGIDRDTADLRRGAGLIYPLMIRNLQRETIGCNERNAALYADLERAGLRLDDGPDHTGWLMKLHRAFKGFYIDMGCAQAIIDGTVRVVQTHDMVRFVPQGVEMRGGAVEPFDAVIAAVGFRNANEDIVQMFGPEIAAKVGPRVGIDAIGEPLGQAKPLHHPQVWQMYGSLNDMRRLSRTLAQQIIAELRGIVPPLERQDDGSVLAMGRS